MVTLKSDPFIIDCAFKCDWNWNGCKCAYASYILLIYTVYPSYSTLNWLYAIIDCSRVCVYVCAVGQSHRLIFINSMQNRIVGLHFVFVSQYFAIQVNYEIGYRFTSTASIILCNFIWFHSIRFVSFPCMCNVYPFCYIRINAIVDSLAIKITIMRVSFVQNSKTFV